MLAAATALFAQNFNDVTKNIADGKYDDAKVKIDKIMSDTKNQSKSEGWFYKAKVYNALAKQNSDSAMLVEALNAMQKYFSIEGTTKDEKVRYLHSTIDNHNTAFDIRANFVNAGVKAYQEENWKRAFYNFEKSLDAFDYLAKAKLTNTALDTNLILYTGAAAQAGRMDAEAVKYYSIIADLKIPDPNNVAVYEFLINYYQTKKDQANRDKYLDMAKALFPKSDSWMKFELAELSDNDEERLKQLEDLMKKYPDDYAISLTYVSDLFNYIYAGSHGSKELKAKLTGAIENVIRINSTPVANYIMTQHISNEIYDIETTMAAIKGTKPEDVQKKKALTEERAAKFEAMLPFALKTYELYSAMKELRPEEKVNLGKTLDNLVDYYQFKKMPDKVTMYQAKRKAL